LRFGSANRDTSAFYDAAEISLQRKSFAGHLAFGHGRHFCIGASLARQEMMTSFQVLSGSLDNFTFDRYFSALGYIPSFFGRNLKELSLAFDRIDV
tara:strand:+ start:332 stop:619 length:288 start_codon:yes stop_codon:yes gene_type:complete